MKIIFCESQPGKLTYLFPGSPLVPREPLDSTTSWYKYYHNQLKNNNVAEIYGVKITSYFYTLKYTEENKIKRSSEE